MMTTDVEYVNWMNSKWKENYQQGMEQGREQGIQLKQERVAKEMLADHMPMDLIMKYSELSEERILELKRIWSRQENYNTMLISERIYKYMEEKGISQLEFAKKPVFPKVRSVTGNVKRPILLRIKS